VNGPPGGVTCKKPQHIKERFELWGKKKEMATDSKRMLLQIAQCLALGYIMRGATERGSASGSQGEGKNAMCAGKEDGVPQQKDAKIRGTWLEDLKRVEHSELGVKACKKCTERTRSKTANQMVDIKGKKK